jgi:glycosyltransferase involved in cell wall biosynthesis
MALLTILTATFNRAHLLPRLYCSLCDQTSSQFEWLVVDDGSTDNTQDLVKKWVAEEKIAIRYMQKENGGKHTAVNLGVGVIHSPLTYIVDSDDWVVKNAVQEILFYYQKYQASKIPLCAFTYHQLTDGKFNGGAFPHEEQIESYPEFQVNRWHGDTAQIFYTSILKKFPFPEYPGKRKMVSEDVAWIRMGLEYPTVYIRKTLTVSEYQADGLTKNLRKSQNYLAQYERGRLYMHPRIAIKFRLRGALMANVYARFCHINQPFGFLSILTFIPARIVYFVWRWKYAMEDEAADLRNCKT